MTAFELALVILNLCVAAIYAAILWVMLKQRSIMDKQLEAMQSQICEAKRNRMAAHRPILRFEPPIASGLPNLEFYQVHNIGAGAALDVLLFVHERSTGEMFVVGKIEPLSSRETSNEFPVLRPLFHFHEATLTLTYFDIWSNRFWTLYDPLEQTHSFGEGEPPYLKR